MRDILDLLREKENLQLQIQRFVSKGSLSEYEQAVLEDMQRTLEEVVEKINSYK